MKLLHERKQYEYTCVMCAGSDTNLLFGNSVLVYMHDIDSPNKSALCMSIYKYSR